MWLEQVPARVLSPVLSRALSPVLSSASTTMLCGPVTGRAGHERPRAGKLCCVCEPRNPRDDARRGGRRGRLLVFTVGSPSGAVSIVGSESQGRVLRPLPK